MHRCLHPGCRLLRKYLAPLQIQVLYFRHIIITSIIRKSFQPQPLPCSIAPSSGLSPASGLHRLRAPGRVMTTAPWRAGASATSPPTDSDTRHIPRAKSGVVGRGFRGRCGSRIRWLRRSTDKNRRSGGERGRLGRRSFGGNHVREEESRRF